MAHFIRVYMYMYMMVFATLVGNRSIRCTSHNIPCNGIVHKIQDTVEAEEIANIIFLPRSNFCFILIETYEPDFNFMVHIYFENEMPSVTGALHAGGDNSTTPQHHFNTITSQSSYTAAVMANSTFIQFTGEVTSEVFVVVRYFAGKTDLTTCANNVPIKLQATQSPGVLVSPNFPEGARLSSVDGINCTWTINGTEQHKIKAMIALRKMGRCHEYVFLLNNKDYCADTFDVVALEADSFDVVMTGGFKDASRRMMVIYTLVPVTATSKTDIPVTISTTEVSPPSTPSMETFTTGPTAEEDGRIPIVIIVIIIVLVCSFAITGVCNVVKTRKRYQSRGIVSPLLNSYNDKNKMKGIKNISSISGSREFFSNIGCN